MIFGYYLHDLNKPRQAENTIVAAFLWRSFIGLARIKELARGLADIVPSPIEESRSLKTPSLMIYDAVRSATATIATTLVCE